MIGYGIIAASLLAAYLLVARHRRRKPAAPDEYDWSVVGRQGVRATFSCGCVRQRVTDYVLRTKPGDFRYRRSVARPDAESVPCGDCLCRTLRTMPPVEAVKEHHLALLSHPSVS
jgi:hypothetical protein